MARLLLGFTAGQHLRLRPAFVNGAPRLVVRDPQDVLSVPALTVDAHRITSVDVVRNPDELTTVRSPEQW
ncbi:hypothetical protein [Embleya sp. NPDC005971]|uniref:hypothetical protein n=1 Tax=Embleya sp. NPDC005971 TaxID=3156724 RepID=UPI0033E408AF